MEKTFTTDDQPAPRSSAQDADAPRKPYSPPELTHYGDMSALTRFGIAGGAEDFIYGGGPPS